MPLVSRVLPATRPWQMNGLILVCRSRGSFNAICGLPSPPFAGSQLPFAAHVSPPAIASPPTDAHVPLGLLVAYEGMSWSPAPEHAPRQRPLVAAPHQCPPVAAPRQRPPVPAPYQRPPVPAPRQRPPVPSPRKCSQVPPLVLPSSSSSPLVPSSSPEHPRESEPPERPRESELPSHGPRTTRHGRLSPTHHGPRSPLIRHGRLSPLIRHGRLSPLIRHGRPCLQIHHGRPNCRLRRGSRNGHRPGGHLSRFQVQSAHPSSPFDVVRHRSRLFGGGVISDFVSLCLVFPCLYLVFLSSLVH